MRVLIGMPDRNSTGGPIANVPPLVEALRQVGVDVVEETYAYGDRESPISLVRRVLRVLGTARRLRRHLRGEQFDLIHLTTAFDPKALLRDAVIVRVLRRSGSKLFLKFHGSRLSTLTTSNPLVKLLRRSVLTGADGFGVLSNEEKQHLLQRGVAENKIFVVKNAVRPWDPAAPLDFAGRWQVRMDAPRLLFISRFVPGKGLITAIHACKIVHDRGYEFTLLCVGDGPVRPAAEAEVRKLALESNVRFFGYVPEEQARSFYSYSTMVLLPTSLYEGFPMVILNALAAGTSIITTRIRTAAVYLREPENCLWVEPRNPEMLAEKMAYLLDHPEVRDSMKNHNLELARQFSPELVASEYMDVYRQLLRAGEPA